MENMIDTILEGDCLELLPSLPDDSIDAIVTDPPYELAFMGRKWDASGIAYNTDMWAECLRVLKPGGHMLAFGGDRTHHRMFCAIEDAGFEIRHTIVWTYGSGFPKSLDISKQIDRTAAKTSEDVKKLKDDLRRVFDASGLTLKELNSKCGFEASGYLRKSSTWKLVLPSVDKWQRMRNTIGTDEDFSFEFKEIEREVIGTGHRIRLESTVDICGRSYGDYDITAPATPAAKQWAGFGSALKPAAEFICLARKPLSESTIAANVLRHGVGGINIDGCRVGFANHTDEQDAKVKNQHGNFGSGQRNNKIYGEDLNSRTNYNAPGRFPANLIWSHSPLCKRIGTKKVKGGNDPRGKDGTLYQGGQFKDNGGFKPGYKSNHMGYGDADCLEEVESWDCDPSCPIWQFAKAGERKSGARTKDYDVSEKGHILAGFEGRKVATTRCESSTGSASRFFQSCPFTEEDIPAFVYCAKSSRSERNAGLDRMCTVKLITDNDLIDGACQKDVNMVAVQLLQKVTSDLGVMKWNIGESGESISALCPLDSLSAILTGINRIIESRTLDLLMHSLISESTQDVNLSTANGGNLAANVENLRKWILTITNEKTALALGASRVALKMLSQTSEKGSWQSFTNFHSTVKPLSLVRYLCRLITPPGGLILDPFAGSGTTCLAAKQEGFRFIGIEKEAEYAEIARRRVASVNLDNIDIENKECSIVQKQTTARLDDWTND